MEPFHFFCPTCAAKLKVQNPKLIGQKLACPKCQSMVLVEAPEGYELPVSATEHTGLSGQFDDIDSILASTPQEAPGQTVRQPRSTTPLRPTTAAPLVPDETWVSPSAQSRRKWVVVISAAAGVILLVIAIIAAVVANHRPSDPVGPVADKDQPLQIGDDTRPTEDTTDPDEPTPDPGDDQPADSTATENPAEDRNDSGDSDTAGAGGDATPTAHDADEPKESLQPERGSPENANDDPPEPNSPRPSGDAKPEDTSRLKLDALLRPLESPPDGSQLNAGIGELAAVLESRGTSLSEINDLALTHRAIASVGMPKYYFEKPDPFDDRTLENLSLSCAGILLDQTPLLSAVRDFTRLTGVPIQWDADAIAVRQIRLVAPVTFKATETDFQGALSKLLESVNLQLNFDGTTFPVITPLDSGTLVTKTYTLPELKEPDETKYATFVQSLQSLIDPDSWTREDQPATVERNGLELSVNQTLENHSRIARYLDRIRAGLLWTAGDDSVADTFAPRWETVDSKLAAAFTSPFRTSTSLIDLLESITQQSEVAVVVDWQAVLNEGWTPLMQVPGRIRESTAGEALRQIARAMQLTTRVVDDQTIELTTFERADQQMELDVYACHKILAGELTDQALMHTLQQALGPELSRLPAMRILYEPECRCLIVLAPQSVHRQVQAILDRLTP